jgi:RNA polymerase sigma-70 factor (ECF subfamily)
MIPQFSAQLTIDLVFRADKKILRRSGEPFSPQTRIATWRHQLADDRETWRKIAQGDAEVFDAFYRENAPRLHAFLRQLVGNPQASEDIAQETFTQIWSHPSGFQPERGPLRAYLFGIGRKRAREWWRKQRPSDHEEIDDEIGVCHTEIDSIVNDAFRRLPEEQRTLLWLREVEGQSYLELASILEIPVGTVRSRLFVAREALRKVWQVHTIRAPKGAL